VPRVLIEVETNQISCFFKYERLESSCPQHSYRILLKMANKKWCGKNDTIVS